MGNVAQVHAPVSAIIKPRSAVMRGVGASHGPVSWACARMESVPVPATGPVLRVDVAVLQKVFRFANVTRMVAGHGQCPRNAVRVRSAREGSARPKDVVRSVWLEPAVASARMATLNVCRWANARNGLRACNVQTESPAPVGFVEVDQSSAWMHVKRVM